MRVLFTLTAGLLGWCFAEAYLIGPPRHRETGRKEAMIQAVEMGYAHLENGKPVWGRAKP